MKKAEPEQTSINLSNLESFKKHPWVREIITDYKEKESIVAVYSVKKLMDDLKTLNAKYQEKNNRVLFVSVDGRVKEEESLSKKLYDICTKDSISHGFSQENLKNCFDSIIDKAGVRFACPYFDDVEDAIDNIIYPYLNTLGYATTFKENELCPKNLLEDGDKFGYRSYHFYVKVPTPIDIFGKVQLFLCEIQARTELQHIWAVKSHDLLYKPKNGWNIKDETVIQDMKHLSNSLRAADQSLVSIRKRITGDENEKK